MASWKGSFDPAISRAFVQCVDIYPVGALVRLQSGRIGVATEVDSGALTVPKVKVSSASCRDRIAAEEDRSSWHSARIGALWKDELKVPPESG